jgi:hypothetical protein
MNREGAKDAKGTIKKNLPDFNLALKAFDFLALFAPSR